MNSENLRRAYGMRYTDFLKALHETIVFEWYLEIGCRDGRTIAPVRGGTIAVDPFFKVDMDIIGVKPFLHIFQSTSDDFFSSGFLRGLGIKIGFSFLDGLHLIEYLLRDFIATERASDRGGVIAIHDCLPFNLSMTTRNIPDRGAWTGDVWKIIPVLMEFRPDLHITVLDAAPTGLVLVSNLDPESSVLLESYESIVQRYLRVELKDFGIGAFNSLLALESAASFLDCGLDLFNAVSRDPALLREPIKISH